MRADQWLSLFIIALMMGAFLWGRYRYDIVAVTALLAAIVAGIVSSKNAFSGFAMTLLSSSAVRSSSVRQYPDPGSWMSPCADFLPNDAGHACS